MKNFIFVSCTLVLVFVSVLASDVLAININEIIGNEYHVKGTSTTYVGGNYAGTAVGEGILKFNASNIIASTVGITDFFARSINPSVYQDHCDFVFGTWTQEGNQLKIDTCNLSCVGQDGTNILTYNEACDMTINLNGAKISLNITLTPTAIPGVVIVWTAKGEFLGTTSPLAP